MKRIQYTRYGGPEGMRLDTFDLGALKSDQVAIKVKFAAINPVDWKVRNGDLKIVTGRTFPRAMGCDFSGTVISVGAAVTRFRPGDAVFGLTHVKDCGALGEAVIASETFLAKKPAGVSFEDAACFGTPGVTAWNGLIDKADLKAGQRVFVNGCTGAVGAATVQIAKMRGATVSGTCSADAVPYARELGVVTTFDYRTTDLAQLRDRFDVVYDTAGTMSLNTGLGLLSKGGVFLDIDPSPGKLIRALFDRRLKPIICTARAAILDGLAHAAESGKLRLPISETVPLAEAIPLITALEQGLKLKGKALVAMPD